MVIEILTAFRSGRYGMKVKAGSRLYLSLREQLTTFRWRHYVLCRHLLISDHVFCCFLPPYLCGLMLKLEGTTYFQHFQLFITSHNWYFPILWSQQCFWFGTQVTSVKWLFFLISFCTFATFNNIMKWLPGQTNLFPVKHLNLGIHSSVSSKLNRSKKQHEERKKKS